jgi:hypothetical protein
MLPRRTRSRDSRALGGRRRTHTLHARVLVGCAPRVLAAVWRAAAPLPPLIFMFFHLRPLRRTCARPSPALLRPAAPAIAAARVACAASARTTPGA